jgi:hypothetical protein
MATKTERKKIIPFIENSYCTFRGIGYNPDIEARGNEAEAEIENADFIGAR